ncbi:hypothetical protein [Granulicatella elegans]|uniref:hypothetical protein n=1 Tax=Granulicatella elegans TaxID=137732 RepID=UPI0028EDB9FE|nr:hypothetical protein [uncultured Granulicatella sp.]
MKEWIQAKKSAFLLIEQLMALAIFAVSILLISGVYQVLLKVQNKLEVPNYIEWHLMATQVDTHLQGFIKTKNYYDVEFFGDGLTNKGSFRFRAEPETGDKKARLWIEKNGGTHYVLIGYEKMLLHSEKDGVRLKGILRNNEKFETYFIPGNRVISVEKEVIQKEESTSSKEVHKKEDSHDKKFNKASKDKS